MFNQFFVFLSFTLFILPIFPTTLCNIPNYIIQSAKNYSEYLHLPYNVICDNTRINISNSIVIIYNEDVNYELLNPDTNYFIVSNSQYFYCNPNIFHVHMKFRTISNAVMYFVRKDFKKMLILAENEEDIQYIEDIFTYYGRKVNYVDTKFNETRLNETLQSYTSYKNVILFNLFSDPMKLSKSLEYYQKYRSVFPITCVTYYVDEAYALANNDLVKGVYIMSGYLRQNNNPENEEFLERFDMDSINSFDDLLFQMYSLLLLSSLLFIILLELLFWNS